MNGGKWIRGFCSRNGELGWCDYHVLDAVGGLPRYDKIVDYGECAAPGPDALERVVYDQIEALPDKPDCVTIWKVGLECFRIESLLREMFKRRFRILRIEAIQPIATFFCCGKPANLRSEHIEKFMREVYPRDIRKQHFTYCQSRAILSAWWHNWEMRILEEKIEDELNSFSIETGGI